MFLHSIINHAAGLVHAVAPRSRSHLHLFAASDVKAEALEEDAPTPAETPVILLGPLENKSCVDELSDGVQSMDVR